MPRIIFTTLLAAVFVLILGVGTAMAVPEKNPQAMTLTLESEEGGTIEVLVAAGNPAFINQTERLIGKVFTFQILVDGKVVFEETGDRGKKKGLQDRLTTYTTEIQLAEDEIQGILELTGLELTGNEEITTVLTVQAMKTPAK